MNIIQTCCGKTPLDNRLLQLLLGLSLLVFSSLGLAESKLKDIKVAALPDDQVEIVLEFDAAPGERSR